MFNRLPDTFEKILLMAIDNAREGITISDACQPDNPLIYVNKGFLKMTGYSAEEVLYKNCRFLQGSQKNGEALKQIRAAVRQQVPVQVELFNFKKDGTPFYNRLSITPVFGNKKKLTHFIGVQEDISAIKQKEELTQQLQRQELIHQTSLQAQEREREAIGKELHDNINQLLATSKLFLNIATDDATEQRELMQQSSAIVDEAIEEIRKLSRKLVQPELNKYGLLQSLQRLVNSMQPALDFRITLQSEVDEEQLSDTKKLMFYRIVQEGLHNSIKYARPHQVTIALQQSAGTAYLIIEDDGVGFDKTKLAQGIGLRNIGNRLEAECGTLEIDTAPGEGCRLKISVPV